MKLKGTKAFNSVYYVRNSMQAMQNWKIESQPYLHFLTIYIIFNRLFLPYDVCVFVLVNTIFEFQNSNIIFYRLNSLLGNFFKPAKSTANCINIMRNSWRIASILLQTRPKSFYLSRWRYSISFYFLFASLHIISQ